MDRKLERRVFPVSKLEVRSSDEEPPTLEGYAVVFNSLSEDLGGFRETVRQGAFTKTLQEADVRALYNHDPNYVIGRTKSGTLELKEDNTGLWMKAYPPETTWSKDLVTTIERGDVDQMSFQFNVVKDLWDEKRNMRELVEVELFDVSPVTFPAYPATNVQVRSVLEKLGVNYDNLMQAVERAQQSDLHDDDISQIQSTIQVLSDLLPSEPGPMAHSDEDAGRRLDILKKHLELVEKAL
jgi:uncharacterized protein